MLANMKIKLAMLILTLVVILVSACSTKEASLGRVVRIGNDTYWGITAVEFHSVLEEDKDFLLVNVDTPYTGEITGTDIFIPYYQLEQRLSELGENKKAKIVLYCNDGYAGTVAAIILIRNGFTNVWHLDGGMIGWERQGYSRAYRT